MIHPAPSPASGILVVDKPRGPTSHDVVAQGRRVFGTRAVGHAGTLDPMATGVLLLLVGTATRLAEQLTMNDKRYEAEICFGRATDTLDAEGTSVEERALEPGWLDPARLADALAAERARVAQIPPAYSAIKVAGRRSHALARSGEAVALPPREVRVLALELLSASDDRIRVALHVSKGYYVRSLARDVGEHLGVPAHLSALRRTASGPWTLDGATPWPPTSRPTLLSVADACRRGLGVALLSESGVLRARRGIRLVAQDFLTAPPAGPVALWLGPDDEPVALGRFDGTAGQVVRGFPSA